MFAMQNECSCVDSRHHISTQGHSNLSTVLQKKGQLIALSHLWSARRICNETQHAVVIPRLQEFCPSLRFFPALTIFVIHPTPPNAHKRFLIFVRFHDMHTATHCNTLQHTATRCETLRHTTTPCNTRQHMRGNAQYTNDVMLLNI